MTTTVESTNTILEPSSIPVEPTLAPGTVRLMNGSGPHEGRVEIFYNGTWGTVCDNFWSMGDGLVVCRQLGYPDVLHTQHNAHFGKGTGPILFDNLKCTGNEGNLTQCPSGDVDCDHSEDAGVTCARESVSPSPATKEPTANTSALPSTTSVVSSPPAFNSTFPVVTFSTQAVVVVPSLSSGKGASSARPFISPAPSPSVDLQPPTGVSVSIPSVSDGALQITLMWSRPELDSGLTGYRVQYSWESRWDPSQFVKRQSERKTMSVNVTASSYTLQDAEGFAEYCFEVSALYEGGMESPAATEMCADTPETSECILGS